MPAKALSCPRCNVPVESADGLPVNCPACGGPMRSSQALTGRRGLRWLALAALTVVVLLAVILVCNRDLLLPGNAPAGAGAALPPGKPVAVHQVLTDPEQPGGPVASLLSVARPSPTSQGRALVSLRLPGYHDSTAGSTDESILAHEIVRQAVLAAARDAGAIARDAVIGDVVPDSDAPADLEVDSFFSAGKIPVVFQARRAASGREVLATYELGRPKGRFLDYPSLVERAEALSRSRDGFPKALEQIGLNGTTTDPKAEGRPGDDVERRLSQLNFAEQFAAIRALHAEMRDHGESPARLGALARGYANLGVLTEFHWGSRHKAFKARALLATQRLVARDPRSPVALSHRAYARALAGFHKDALDDLAEAERLAKAHPAEGAAPGWVPLVDALCRFQTDKLLQARNGKDGPLAMLLAFMTFEESKAGVLHVVSLGQDVLRENPECFRVHDSLCRTGDVGSWHVATLAGLRAMDLSLPRRLKGLPGLPDRAGTLLNDASPEPAVVKALVETGQEGLDQGEPSWASLGGMVSDTRFALVYRRGNFMRHVWGVPADDFLDEVWPLVAHHPYRAALEAFRLDPRRDFGRFNELLSTVQVPDICYNEYPFIYQVGMADIERHKHLIAMMICHGDVVYRDFAAILMRIRADSMADAARDLEKVCPFAPLSRARLVEHDWIYAEPRAREWEEGAGGRPDVLSALGSRYLRLERWDDAERCLKKAAALSPDTSTYRLLAEVFKRRGDLEGWEKALKQSLAETDLGLGHMHVDVEIANHYMDLAQWDKALPHAESAAATWAAAGLLCASRCREGMGDSVVTKSVEQAGD